MKILAAGSLRLAFEALQPMWTQEGGEPLDMEFGPAGRLKEMIEAGYYADLYISANIAHSQSLVEQKLAQSYQSFIFNSLCLTVVNKPPFSTRSLEEILQTPGIRIGMSTPKSDPGGDYACLFFEKFETLYTGAGKALQKNAKQLVGGAQTIVPVGENAPRWLIENGYIDAFIGYTTSTLSLRQEKSFRVIDIPKAMNIDVCYSLALITDNAKNFSLWLMSSQVQKVLASFGFEIT